MLFYIKNTLSIVWVWICELFLQNKNIVFLKVDFIKLKLLTKSFQISNVFLMYLIKEFGCILILNKMGGNELILNLLSLFKINGMLCFKNKT